MLRQGMVFLALLAAALPAASQPTFAPGALACLPNEANAVFEATVTPEVSGSDSVRLYLRRINKAGGFYWVEMNPAGGGKYWAVFPKPEEREQQDLTDDWWEILKSRDWMEGRDREWLEDWFDSQEHELVEYYVAVADVNGAEVARSRVLAVEVLDREDCRVVLDPFQLGQADNLTAGETTAGQAGQPLFHWLCDGVVSRVSFEGVLRGDDVCRACVVAGILPVSAFAGALVAGVTIEKREPERVSDDQP